MTDNYKRTIAITGPTSGIGKAAARAFAKEGHPLILIGRNQEKLRALQRELQTINEAEVWFYLCDLADLKSIRRCASEISKEHAHIDSLLNNAGGIIPELRYSADDIEYSFAMNHLGHFYLTKLLKALLAKAEKPRVISVSSMAHKMGDLDFKNLARRKSYAGFKAYADAKLCNIYFTKELAHRWSDINISAYCLHPGVVNTGFASEYGRFMKFLMKLGSVFMISPEKGAETSIYLSTAKDLSMFPNGSYFAKKQPAQVSKLANNKATAQKLWEYSDALIKF